MGKIEIPIEEYKELYEISVRMRMLVDYAKKHHFFDFEDCIRILGIEVEDVRAD